MKAVKDIALEAFQRVMERAAEALRRQQQKPRYVVLDSRLVAHRARLKRDGKILTVEMPVKLLRVVDRQINDRLHRDRTRLPYSRARECARRRLQIARGILKISA